MMLEIISQTRELRIAPEPILPLIVTRECIRCSSVLRVEVGVNENEDGAISGAMSDQEWATIGGQLFCGGCVYEIQYGE